MSAPATGCSRAAAAWHAAAALGVAGALLSAACALAPRFATPQLSILGVQLLSSDLWQQRLKVRMRVQNPNDRTLPVRGLEYTLEVEGQEFANGASDASFVVPARGEAQFDMSVTTNAAGTLMKLLGRGPDALGQSIRYRISGKISLSEGWLRSIPFEQQGAFKLQ
ncbi:MAG: LEA type 2 family protein [Steroidobacteraceae bacterium]